MKQLAHPETHSPRRAPIRSALAATLAMLGLGIQNPLHGQEFGFTGGDTAEKGLLDRSSYSWELFYRQPLRPWLGLSMDWDNEGHLLNDHRDGQSIQAWYPLLGWGHPWGLALGAGPYHYYDSLQTQGNVVAIRHGFGVQSSLELSYQPSRSNWAVVAQAFSFNMHGGPATVGVQTGAAYRFGLPQTSSERAPEPAGGIPQSRLSVATGITVLNTQHAEASVPLLLEYRRALSAHWAVAMGYARDGESGPFRRQGLTLQGWLGGFPGNGPLFFGVGLGPELARTTQASAASPGESPCQIGARTSIEAGWRFSASWSLAVAWHRTIWPSEGDTDQIVTSLNYTW